MVDLCLADDPEILQSSSRPWAISVRRLPNIRHGISFTSFWVDRVVRPCIEQNRESRRGGAGRVTVRAAIVCTLGALCGVVLSQQFDSGLLVSFRVRSRCRRREKERSRQIEKSLRSMCSVMVIGTRILSDVPRVECCNIKRPWSNVITCGRALSESNRRGKERKDS